MFTFLKKKEKNTKNVVKKDFFLRKFISSTNDLFKGDPDKSLITLVGFLSLAGLLMIYSASAISAYNDPNISDSFFYFNRQILWIFIGVISATVLYVIPLDFLKIASPFILSVGIILMIILIPEAVFKIDIPFVLTKNGATRWIDLVFMDLQPAELIKLGSIIYISAWISKKEQPQKPKEMSEFKFHMYYNFLPFVLFLGFICILIIAQRDLDTAIILVASIISIYFVAGKSKLHSFGTFFILFVGGFLGSLALYLEDYRRSRLLSFWTIFRDGQPSISEAQSSAFQVWNGLVGFGSGWLFGRGFGESRIKQGFLQEAAYTDSIFVVIGEEFGLFGAIAIIVSFLLFASIGYSIATKSKDQFHILLATGMTTWITVQAFLNIASNVALIPFGGMPLPFFTYGGSSMLTIMMAIGIMLNVSKNNTTERKLR